MPLVVPPLTAMLRQSKVPYQIILVDNGSSDSTGGIIDRLAASDSNVCKVHVPINRGYGLGIRTGLKQARGEFVAYMPGDGQTQPEDLVATYNAMLQCPARSVVKGVRVVRDEGAIRALMSLVYRTVFKLLFGFTDPDVNGVPKMIRRLDLEQLNLNNDQSFICAELLVKAHKFGFQIIQVPVQSIRRVSGKSKVTPFYPIVMLSQMVMFRLKRGWESR